MRPVASLQTVPAVILAAVLAGAAAPGPGGRSTRELLQAGILAIEESNFPRAAARFREAAQIDPRLVQAHFGLGLAALGEHDRKSAERALREAEVLSRGAPEVRYTLGVTRFVFNDLRLAEDDLKTAAGDRFFLEARYALGIVAAVRGDLQGAAAALREALRLDGRHAASRYQLGAVLARSGDLDGALNELGKALAIDPDIMDARPEDPIEFASRSVRSSSPGSAGLGMPIPVPRPSVGWPRRAAAAGVAPARDIPDWFLYYQMALKLADASHWQGAVDMLERALSIKDRSEVQAPVADRLVDYSPHLHLAEAYHHQGNFREAFLHLGIAKNEGNVPPDALRALEVLVQKDRLRPVILLETLPDRTTEETVPIRGVIISEEPVPRVQVGGRDAILRPATTAEVSALLPDRDHPAPKEAVQSTYFEVPAYRLPAIGPNRIRIRPTFRNPARQGDLIEVQVVRLPRATKAPAAAAPSRGAP